LFSLVFVFSADLRMDSNLGKEEIGKLHKV
jgi:hypothetical protein